MARRLALAVALVAVLLPVSGAGGTPDQSPKRGGTATVPGLFAGNGEPGCLNPLRSVCERALDHVEEVLEGAFEVGVDKVRPNLVTRVERTTRPPLTLTYRIRADARWSDGMPITARDFAFTHRAMLRANHVSGFESAHATNVRGGVRVVDAKTAEVVLRAPLSGWRSGLFPFLLPRHALQGENLETIWTDRIDNPNTGQPIGSGPFLVERWERGKHLVLRRNARYWGAHPAYLDRLVLRFQIDDWVDALRSRELDAYEMRLGLDPDGARKSLTIPGIRHRYSEGYRWEHFEIRMASGGHPALRSPLVRRALAYGLDRRVLARRVFGEFVATLEPAQSAVFLPTSPHYRPNWRRYRHDPGLARGLLEQAGCQRGTDRIYSCGGARLSLRFVANAGSRSRSLTIDAAAEQLRAIGVEVLPRYFPGSVLLDQLIPSGEWDVWIISNFYVPDQPVDGAFRCRGPVNATGYCQTLVTRELDRANRALDPVGYASALNRADEQMARDVPVIPLWMEPRAAALRSTLRGYVPVEPFVAWNAEDWWLDD